MRTGSSRRGFLRTVGVVATAGATTKTVTGQASGESAPDANTWAAASDGYHRRVQAGEEWPTFGYDSANTGHNPEGVGAVENVDADWVIETGHSITASPVVKNGVVYVGNSIGELSAMDATSGRELDGWPVTLGEEIRTPAVAEGIVYVPTSEGVVHALDATSGEQYWRFGTGRSIVGAPTVVDDTVYVGSEGETTSSNGVLSAIVAGRGSDGGTERWSYETSGAIESTPAVGTVDSAGSQKQLLVVGTTNGFVYGLDVTDGPPAIPEWRYEEIPGPIRSSPAISDGEVYVGSLGNGRVEGYVHALEATDGSHLWSFDADGAVVGSPAVGEENIYVGSRSHELVAIDRSTGETQWAIDTGRPIRSSPALVDGTVYFTSEDGNAYAADTEGDERWSFDTGGLISASPAVAGGTVYVANTNGSFYALREGGDFAPGGEDDEATEGVLGRDEPHEYAFLVIPALIAGIFGLIGAIGYVIVRSGWTEQFAVDEPPVERLYEDEDEPIPDYDGRRETAIWSAIVDDVITRADSSQKIATENVIVTRYVDRETFDAPVAAYVIESARDERSRIRLTERYVDADLANERLDAQPLNEGWTLEDVAFVFETTVEPGSTVKTMVGRLDCPPGEIDTLVADRPTLAVEPLENGGDSNP